MRSKVSLGLLICASAAFGQRVAVTDGGGGGYLAGVNSSGYLEVLLENSSIAVTGTFYQATQPVSAASLPLPTGAATSALQTTGNTSLSTLATNLPAQGQALAAASMPVVLPAAQITTLTPPTTINPTPQSTSTYAATAFDLAATAATNVKGSGGNVWGWFGFNPNATACYLQFYNSTSAVLGTSPLHPFGIPAGAAFNVMPGSIAAFNLSTGISTGQTTTATGSTPCSSAMVVTILYN